MENEDRESKKVKGKPVREHKAVINGKEEAEGSGTMTFSYKRLHVPKELMKKVKKLVETTTGLNNTFIQFIQQATAKQGDRSIRYRHLKAFKAVLADLKKAHCSLEEALVCEFRSVEVQNGEEGQEALLEVADGVEPVPKESMEVDGEQHEEPKEKREKQEAEQGSSDEKGAGGINTKSCQAEAMATPVKTEACDEDLLPAAETSLDQDIMSVPPSVPEELFQMVESLADSTMLLQNNSNSFSDSEKTPESVEPDSVESKHAQPKVKNLIVKLTPVPVVTTCGSRSPSSKNREREEESKHRGKNQQSEEKAEGSPPPTRRSSRVKTTPLRKQAENKDKEESSEVDEDVKSKAKGSKKSSKAPTEDGAEVKTPDSDSDGVPEALLEKAAAGHSTDEEQESTRSKKCLFKANNTSAEDADKASKRKRNSESSDSDLEQKGKKVSKKKKKQKDSEPPDSNLEKKSKSKGSVAKRRCERAKKDASKEESKNSPERRASTRKRSYEKKHKQKGSKAASTLQTSSSEAEEELQDGGDSGEDSDVQKIKPIVEDTVVGADGAFHQSSGNLICARASAPMTCLHCYTSALFTRRCFMPTFFFVKVMRWMIKTGSLRFVRTRKTKILKTGA